MPGLKRPARLPTVVSAYHSTLVQEVVARLAPEWLDIQTSFDQTNQMRMRMNAILNN